MAKATRVAFICKDNKLYQEYFTFEYFNGFALSQKRKNIESFHKTIKSYGIDNILEVSRRNENIIGTKLSAFNLQITINNKQYPIECIYQSSKVFNGKQFIECLNMTPSDAKRYVKEQVDKDNLSITSFKFQDVEYPIVPFSFFYDYVYIKALDENKELGEEIIKYDCFTDVEFNQNKQFACQARSCALYKYLKTNDLLDIYLQNPFEYKYLYKDLQIKTLFDNL